MVSHHGVPCLPQSGPGVDEEDRINVGKSFRVSHQKRLSPLMGLVVVTGTPDRNIICCSLTTALKPCTEKIPVRKFNDCGTVAMLFLKWKNIFQLEGVFKMAGRGMIFTVNCRKIK